MGKTKSNVPKSKRGGYDLYARRPMSGCSLTPKNKLICRRMERRRKKMDILQEMKWDEI